MTKRLLIDAAHPEETRVVIEENGRIEEFDFVTSAKHQIKGNIYLAKITRVEPSLQAAFVEYGGGKQGFLSFSEIHPDYYQIPVSDRQRLIEEQRAAEEAEEEAEEAEYNARQQHRSRNEEGSEDGDAEEGAREGEDGEDGDRSRRGGRRRRGRGRNRRGGRGRDRAADADPQPGESQDNLQSEGEAAPEDAHDAPGEQPEDDQENLGNRDDHSDDDTQLMATKARVVRSRRPRKKAAETEETEPAEEVTAPEDAAIEEAATEPPSESAQEAAAAEAVNDEFIPREIVLEAPEATVDAALSDPESSNPYRFDETSGYGDQTAAEGDEESAEDDSDVETVSGDESEETRSSRRPNFYRRYKIQEVIKRNQIVLVQVIKEERGNKGVSLTTYISLAGRYCVVMPNSPKGGGISRKIASGEDRKRLKEIVAELRDTKGMSAIIRTAGIDRSNAEIKRDYEYLVNLWQEIRETTLKSTAPALIYEEGKIVKRAIRDLYKSDIDEIIIEGADAYHDAKEFMKALMPSHAPRIKEHTERTPIFYSYGVEDQLSGMHQPRVRLPSGGYIIIQSTEALTAIDVNSGRSTTERNVEETAIKTNLEAVQEVARQLRLRDIAGLIVVDFIDMVYGKNRRSVERALKDALKIDRAKIQMSRISTFGLVELSRQRLRPSLSEASMVTCQHCNGTGMIRADSTVAIQAIRVIEKEAASGEFTAFRIVVRPETAVFMLNNKRELISEMEAKFNVSVSVTIDTDVFGGSYRIYKTRQDGNEVAHEEDRSAGAGGSKRRGRGGRDRNRGGRGGRDRFDRDERDTQDGYEAREENDSPNDVREIESAEPQDNEAPAPREGESESERKSRRGRRGRRGRGGRDRDGREGREPREGRERWGHDANDSAAPAAGASDTQSDADAGGGASHHTPRVQADPVPTTPVTYELPDEQDNDPTQPKRRGWWHRVTGS